MKILSDILWGYHVLILILLVGIKFTFKSRFFQVRKFFYWMKQCFTGSKEDKSGISPFAALCTALAGSIGTGNIVGVGLAISTGGAGAIFWMWISAFFGMMTVYFEIYYSQKYKGLDIGAFSYIKKMPFGAALSLIYAMGCVLSCLTMGNMAQANSFSKAANSLNISPYISGAFLCVIIFILSQKGIKSVSALTEKLVPLMTLLFFVMSSMILFLFRHNLPSVFNEIFENAFSLRATLGGGMFVAMKVGISRGVFTNEAGLGLSTMAFSNVFGKTSKELACFGIFQVFIDTIVMCTITALCILSVGNARSGDFLSINAFEAGLGQWGYIGINLCMALFAFATICATSYYGKIGINYLSKGKWDFIFPYLFAACAFLGSILPLTQVFEISDTFNGFLAIPNILALIFISSTHKNKT